ncbi:OLC1v1024434C1 [Oldenlandia corymbosa var. corymbosa]|uniref:OLC1v1024434C1 n=1 Tax=Oldenlandia corymbosa var. corymbosa TaxID=529605 RepID=A0AAV1C555_OLDCO|nr:OLC1v1024434C1 [Oldenlandia corymbosa var. corymbosa]
MEVNQLEEEIKTPIVSDEKASDQVTRTTLNPISIDEGAKGLELLCNQKVVQIGESLSLAESRNNEIKDARVNGVWSNFDPKKMTAINRKLEFIEEQTPLSMLLMVIFKVFGVEKCFSMDEVKKVPIWVQLPKLKLQYWNKKTLSRITSLIGTPIEMDEMLRNRAGYTRVIVEVTISHTLATEIWFEDEFGIIQVQKVRCEWLPVKCQQCKGFGHEMAHCRKIVIKVWKPAERKQAPPEMVGQEHQKDQLLDIRTRAPLWILGMAVHQKGD